MSVQSPELFNLKQNKWSKTNCHYLENSKGRIFARPGTPLWTIWTPWALSWTLWNCPTGLIKMSWMDPWILRDMECLNPLPSCSQQKLSLSIQKDLKINKVWYRKQINLLQVGNIQNIGPLKFGFAVPKGSGIIQLNLACLSLCTYP